MPGHLDTRVRPSNDWASSGSLGRGRLPGPRWPAGERPANPPAQGALPAANARHLPHAVLSGRFPCTWPAPFTSPPCRKRRPWAICNLLGRPLWPTPGPSVPEKRV